jgi:hypothetical protein
MVDTTWPPGVTFETVWEHKGEKGLMAVFKCKHVNPMYAVPGTAPLPKSRGGTLGGEWQNN